LVVGQRGKAAVRRRNEGAGNWFASESVEHDAVEGELGWVGGTVLSRGQGVRGNNNKEENKGGCQAE
jgi:hypothetical protein